MSSSFFRFGSLPLVFLSYVLSSSVRDSRATREVSDNFFREQNKRIVYERELGGNPSGKRGLEWGGAGVEGRHTRTRGGRRGRSTGVPIYRRLNVNCGEEPVLLCSSI